MIEIEKVQSNWKNVDDLYSHLELIYRRMYDRNPQKLEDGLREISAWLSYSLNTLQIGGRHQNCIGLIEYSSNVWRSLKNNWV